MSSFQQLVDVRGESECARLAERFQAAYPFPHVCIDGFFRPEFIARLVAQFPAAGTRQQRPTDVRRDVPVRGRRRPGFRRPPGDTRGD